MLRYYIYTVGLLIIICFKVDFSLSSVPCPTLLQCSFHPIEDACTFVPPVFSAFPVCNIGSILSCFCFVILNSMSSLLLPHYYVSTLQRVNILYISTLLCFKFPIYYIFILLCAQNDHVSTLLCFNTVTFPHYYVSTICFHTIMFPQHFSRLLYFYAALFLQCYSMFPRCFAFSIVFICSALTLSCLQFYWFCFSFSSSFILFPL